MASAGAAAPSTIVGAKAPVPTICRSMEGAAGGELAKLDRGDVEVSRVSGRDVSVALVGKLSELLPVSHGHTPRSVRQNSTIRSTVLADQHRRSWALTYLLRYGTVTS